MNRLHLGAPWLCYGSPGDWPQSAGRMFLAEAVNRVGQALCIPWNGDESLWILRPPLPEIPTADQAFAGPSEPIIDVHLAYAEEVRSIISAGAFAAEMLSEEEWIRSCVPDPEGGPPLPLPLFRSKRGEDQFDPITYDHWEFAKELSDENREMLGHAQASLKLTARTLQRAVIERRVRSFVRAIGGDAAGPMDMPAAWWEIDDPLPVISRCAINSDAPFDPTVDPTHFIFLDRAELIEELATLQPEWLVDPGPELQSEGYSAQIVREVTSFLIEEFGKHSLETKSAEFRALAEDARGAPIPETSWRAAWRNATAHDPRRRRAGRPRKDRAI